MSSVSNHPDSQEIHRLLRAAGPGLEPVPPALHSSILRALRQPQQQILAPKRGGSPRLVWGVPLLVLALVSVAVLRVGTGPARQPDPAPVLNTATSALDQGQVLAGAAPASLVTPLHEELRHVNQDIERAARFLAASLPAL